DDRDACGVLRVEPERIRVRDLVEPLGVARARVDERRQPEGRQQDHLALGAVELRPVDVAPDVVGHRLLRPLPRLERLREELELARRRRKAETARAVDLDPRIPGGRRILVGAVHLVLDQEGAVLPHVLERRQLLLRRRRRQSGHAVLEDPPVQLLDAELQARAVRRLEVLPDPEGAVGIDLPRELDPELVFFPDLAEPRGLVSLPGEIERLALLLERDAEHGLAKADPSRRVGLLRHEVVALGGVPPGVPTAPISTTISSSARATCQPPRLPAAVLRQTWVASAEPARPISRATSTIVAAATPLSASANSGVKLAYSSPSARSNASKVTGRSGRSSRRRSEEHTSE